MKNKKVITVCISFGVFLFAFRWFYWDIIDIITPFLIFIPTIIILISTVIFLVYSIVYATKNAKKLRSKAFIPLLIVVVFILLNLFFPFTKTTLSLDFKLHYSARNEVVELIKSRELKSEDDNESLILLPQKYRGHDRKFYRS